MTNEKPKLPKHIRQNAVLIMAFIFYCIGLSIYTDTESPLFLRNLILGELVPATIGTILIVKETREQKRQTP